MDIRPLSQTDRGWAAALVTDHFASTEVISRGVRHDTRLLPGLVVELEGRPVGLLQYHLAAEGCEVVVLIARRRRQGIGRALLEHLRRQPELSSCRRLWLITTNDNRDAQAFYERVGFRQVAVHHGAVDAARLLKPEIPKHGHDGTPICDEIEFEAVPTPAGAPG